MATEKTSKEQIQPSTDTKKKEPKPENIFRNLSLREFLSVLDQKGIDPKKAKLTIRM